MNHKSRRVLRAVAAIAATGSLMGVQALTSTAQATSTPIPWIPNATAPANTGFWSNSCPAAASEPTNLHTAATLSDDTASIAATRTFVAGQAPLPDTGWSYQTPSGVEGGLVLGNLASTTTGLSIDVDGATTGRLLVSYTDSKGHQYVGEQQLTTASGWQTVSASTLTWWQSYSNGWGYPNALGLNLSSGGQSATLAAFLAGKTGGTGAASFELGCTGSFAVDNLSVTDSSAGTTTYQLQSPTSSTSATASTGKVGPGGAATITSKVSVSSGTSTSTITDGTTSLESSTDGGATWTTGPAGGGRTFTVKPTQNTEYKVLYDGAPDAAASTSSTPVTIDVAPTLALKASPTTMNVQGTATFTATFKPARTGVPITFQQKVGTTWQSLGTADTNSSGIATFKHARAASGLWTVRATAPTQSGLLASNVPTTSVKVYQPVTIPMSASPHSLYVGGSVRIGGVVTPRTGGIKLQLQQLVNRRWVTIRTTKTGTHGGYTFVVAANYAGTATFRVVAPATGYRRYGASATHSVTIRYRPVYTPPPVYVAPSSGGSGGSSHSSGGGGNGIG